MKTIEQLREDFKAQLDAWHAHVTALELQLNLGRREALDHLEQRKKQFSAALDQIKHDAERALGSMESDRRSFADAFDHLRLQLALGRAETRDRYVEQAQAIRDAMARLDAEFDRRVDSLQDALGEKYVHWSHAVKAELDAVAAQFEETRVRQEAAWETRRKELEESLAGYKKQIEEAQQQAVEHAQRMQGQLAEGMDQLRESFSKLFSPPKQGGGS